MTVDNYWDIERTYPHEPKEWNVANCTSWGNRISVKNHTEADGHTTPQADVGDVLITPMKSGKVMRYEITAIHQCLDPGDMWFAQLKGLGYEEADDGSEKTE